MNNQKGGSNVVDDFCDLADFVAVGIDQRLHNGRRHSYPAGHCRHRASDPTSSGEENIVAACAPSRRSNVFGMDTDSHAPKDFTEG